MKKIAVFGSAFNPVHVGHLIMAERARNILGLEKIILVPTNNPYHKKFEGESFEIRLKMLERTVENNETFIVSDIERDFKGASYTYDLIMRLKKDLAGDYYFIIGGDSLKNFHTWYRYDDLLKEVKLVVFKRPGEDVGDLVEKYSKSTKIIYVEDFEFEISSSFIRQEIKRGNSLRYILEDSTIDFINKNALYLNDKDYESIKNDLKEKLKPSRFEHIIRVVEAGLEINDNLKLGLDEEKIKLACLLHDCAKNLEQYYFNKLKDYIDIQEEILFPKYSSHARIGSIVARIFYGIDDQDILNAIKYHTCGRKGMSNLEKIVFLADYIETGRSFEGVEQARIKAREDLNYAVLTVLNQEIDYHSQKDDIIDNESIEARDDILRRIDE